MKKYTNILLIACCFFLVPIMTSAQRSINVRKNADSIEIDNSLVKAQFVINKDYIEQKYFADKSGEWVLVTSSFLPPEATPYGATTLYSSDVDPLHRLIVPEGLSSFEITEKNDSSVLLKLIGKLGPQKIEQTVRLNYGEDFFHIEVGAILSEKPARLDYLLLPFTFNLEGVPAFVHTPTLKGDVYYPVGTDKGPVKRPPGMIRYHNEPDQIIGDRMFQSPAVILQENNLFCALVPDLDMINDHKVLSPDARQHATSGILMPPRENDAYSMPTGLDLQVKSGLTKKPLFCYGYIDALATHHMKWVHYNDGSMTRTLDSNILRFGFDLFVSADEPENRGYQRISRHIWKRFGSKTLRNDLRPQAMPFDEYARVIYPAGFAYKGSSSYFTNTAPSGFNEADGFVEWEMQGKPVGGWRLNAPFWYDILTNSPWWNNVQDAVGMYYFGQKLSEPDWIDKSRRVINLAMLAPQDHGLFPTMYATQRHKWIGNHWNPTASMKRNESSQILVDPINNTTYHSISCSKTAVHLLEYLRYCEDDARILPYVKRYADFLITEIDEVGTVPAWFNDKLEPNPVLRESGEGGIHLWFLSELYSATNEKKYLNSAKKIADYLIKEVLPTQRWRDFECYMSCGYKPLNYYDEYQGMEPRGTQSTIWAMEGFAALYRACREMKYLVAGEQVVDYSSLYQVAWVPHYIYTAFPFGSWNTDNGDCAWVNCHTAWVVGALEWYAIELGRQDLLERAVAAARGFVFLFNHPRHIKNDIYKYPTGPYGLGPENVDHEGIPQTSGRSGPGAGETTGISAGVADALRDLGGAYINVKKNLYIGVDGIDITSYKLQGRTLSINIKNRISSLPFPYEEPFKIDLKVEGLPDQGIYTLMINNNYHAEITASELSRYSVTIPGRAK